ncbi:MAG: zinc dependent phospholipase C family protein [Deltaproteobacteria bacterium]|nr:zinc dependent phospholipase C family protein [Deltaproteobacteria bacterium]
MEEPAAQFPPNHLLAPSGLHITFKGGRMSKCQVGFFTLRKMSLLLCLISFSPQSLASGMFAHSIMGKFAVARLKSFKHKMFLKLNYTAYQNGVIYPDVGYQSKLKVDWGEWNHFATFLNAYMRHIRNRCAGNMGSLHCHKMLAHYMGSFTHSVSDFNFDHYFVTAVAKHTFGGDMTKAQTYTDSHMDVIVLTEHRFHIMPLRPWAPYADLFEVYKSRNKPVPYEEIKRCVNSWVLTREAFTSMAGIVAHPLKFESPWAAKNYMTAKGGVYDTAKVVAGFLDQMWKILEEESFFKYYPKVRYTGHWPRVSIEVLKAG